MVVIGEPQPLTFQPPGQFTGLLREASVALGRSVCLRDAGHDHVLATPVLALGDDPFQVGGQAVEPDMGGARGQVGAPELCAEPTDRVGPDPGDLDRSIADLAQAAEHAAEPRWILQLRPERVELDRDHVAATRSASIGSSSGRPQVLEIVTRRPLSFDSRIESMTSST